MKLSQALLGVVFSAGVIFAGTAAAAQDKSAPAPAAAAGELKPIGDWHLRCTPGSSQVPCVMFQELARKNGQTQLPILAITIGYDTAQSLYVAMIGVPNGVALANGIIIKTENYTGPALPYLRCDRSLCFMQGKFPDEIVSALNHATQGKVQVTLDSDGKNYDIPFSLKGFSEARDAIVELARQKSGKTAPAAPADQGAPPAQ